MEKVKLAIIYYSSTGTNYQLAQWAEKAALEVKSDVRLLKVEELAPKSAIEANPAWKAYVDTTSDVPLATSDDLEWADTILFSVPSRFGNLPSQMKQFIDSQGGLWAQGKLTNKVVSAMASAGNTHGGQEATIKALYTSMMHWGAIIVPPGYTDSSIFQAGGNPYGTSVTVDQNGKMIENVEAAVNHQVKRMLEITSWIKRGQI
ncbi:MAG: NAD(P)H:quinone oxidoreductase [Epulopiscium sp.]|nr:NAD(P)H:quinone oxidoreductase [Candidatus Epulonipiscium sp.]